MNELLGLLATAALLGHILHTGLIAKTAAEIAAAKAKGLDEYGEY